MSTTIRFTGGQAQPIFLHDFAWIAPLAATPTRPITSRFQVFHDDAANLGSTATLTILFETFAAARALADQYASGTIATLTDPTLGLTFRHRADGQADIAGVRVGQQIKLWRLTVKGVEQP